MLLFESLKAIAQLPALALRLIAFPFAITLVAELFYTHRILGPPSGEDTAGMVITALVGFFCVGLIAVGWHRSFLIGDDVPWVPSYGLALYG